MKKPILLLLASSGALFAAEWKPLFDGKSIDSWVKRGGKAAYRVDDGAIVGTSTLNTPNTFLCTPRDYTDFVLEYEFKVDPLLNSGVQIRSQEFDHATEIPTATDKMIKVPAKRVHGLQVEIDPEPKRARWWSGGIYEEAARGWMFPGFLGGNEKDFTKTGAGIFKQNDWNKVRVEARGPVVKTWLNGTERATITDFRVPSGFFGFQVHGIGNDKAKDGTEVRWRNIRIQELEPQAPNTISVEEKAAGWKLLWDGKTSAGWHGAKQKDFPKKGWAIENGMLSVLAADGAESADGGDIITDDKYSDFELTVDFKITPGANSGIKIFVDPEINKGEGSAIGPEFQILDDFRHPDAKLGKDGNRTIGSLYDLIPAPKNKPVTAPGQWNRAHIIAKGNNVEYRLNGVTTVKYERGTPEWKAIVAGSKYKVWPSFGELKEGHILLQDHGNAVSYRNIKIRTGN